MDHSVKVSLYVGGREGGRGGGGESVIIETEMHIQLLELTHLIHTVFFVLTLRIVG